MREPTFLEYLFIYENDEYGWPKYRTNQINWIGVKYLSKKSIIKIWEAIKWLLPYVIPSIISYFLGRLSLFF